MNIPAATELIELACTHYGSCRNDYTRKLLLHGIYDLADACIEAMQELNEELGDVENYDKAISELEIAKEEAETALKTDNLGSAFAQIAGISLRAVPLPPDN